MNKRIYILFITTLLSCEIAFCQQKLQETIEVRGVVKDNSTLLPVSGAEVNLLGTDLIDITDVNGSFLMHVPASSLNFIDTLIITDTRYWGKREIVQLSNKSDIEVFLSAAKQRLIVSTDLGGWDPDDEQSMVHLLVSSNEIDIEGIVLGLGWVDNNLGIDTLNSLVEAFGKVYSNLKIHADGFPTKDYIMSVIKTGQPKPLMAAVGEGKDTPGSEWIIDVVDRNDPRPVWINIWNGANSVAQAFWKVQNTRTCEEVNRFVHKIRIYDILGQDDAGAWMVHNFPDLIYLRNKDVFGWAPSDDWVKVNVQSRGPLGSKYPDRVWFTEGDSPAFMYLISYGLNDPNYIDQGSWGGRFNITKESGIRAMEQTKSSGVDETIYDPYLMYSNTSDGVGAINQWKEDIWNDLAARMIWSVTNKYDGANHHPIAIVNGDKTRQVIEYSSEPNSTILLDASKSKDPDGDNLNYNWFFYIEPSTYIGTISIENDQSPLAKISIPADAKGKSIHIILKLSDSGNPSLVTYRRIIININ